MRQFILFLFLLLPFCIYSQVNETFDGPEIDSDWIGKDRDKFVVNTDGRLQLNIQPTASGSASIGRNIEYAADMQWEFDVLMNNVPSEKNRLYAYLYIEPENFFYVCIGFDGDKKLGLCRKGGQDMFKRNMNNYKKGSWVHIKVTLEENKYWTLYSRQHADTYYVKEGVCTYPVNSVPKGQFSFKFLYTETRSRLFSIDNVRIQHEITPTDTIPPVEPEIPAPSPADLPELEDIQVLTASSLQFVFTEAVRIEHAVFSISGIGNALRATYADESKAVINTLFPDELQPDEVYTVSYEGVTDVSGNNLSAYSEKWSTATGNEEDEKGDEDNENDDENDTEAIPSKAVLINEVMADPKGLAEKGNLPETEYVEVYNTLNQEVSLSGWQFVYQGQKPKTIGNIQLPSGGYAVLYRASRDIKVDAGGLAIPLESFPASLANAGKMLQLLDAKGNVVDEVTYEKATPGKSWERAAKGWILSTDPRGGTPGSKNSSSEEENPGKPDKPEIPDTPDEPDTPEIPDEPDFSEIFVVEPGEIVFNELLPEPYSGGSEYMELYNRSGRTLSLAGLSVAVRKTDGSLSTRYPLSAVHEKMEPDSYALLTKSKEGVSSFYLLKSPDVVYELPKLPILANTSSSLVLFRTKDECVVDEVSYSSKWHASSIKDRKGVALERIHPDMETQNPANWTSATETAGYGTPGYRNSQYGISNPEDATGIDAPAWIEEGRYYILSYLLDTPGYYCRAFVYDISGRRVAEIANHALLGTSGQLTWDGTASGHHLKAGAYIFYAELYHPAGNMKKYKKTFLVY
ncbi:lamin tail domain-containing protein [Parabacteroides sp. AM08-6]|uniref:lamin tail domain-containing protein n=1 Tax=Parabacteroides sp. AM08-6 TaxID=2292053 RepID=UPI000EFE196A|nr:lamin tail domain-containing protein [Parabacteroides sp. AM08-6]RHJ78692.1 lamin tail domain-containing protein [Parabacteroides sp. AM08-6]